MKHCNCIRWFIPERLRQVPLEYSRAQNVIFASIIGGIAAPSYAVFYHSLGFAGGSRAIALASLVILGMPFLLKTTASVNLVREVYVTTVFLLLAWLSYSMGGLAAPSTPWFIVCPFLAMLLGGLVSGISWLALGAAVVGGFYWLQVQGTPLPANPATDPLLLLAVSTAGLFVVVTAFVLVYEITKRQGFKKLEQALRIIEELAIRDELTDTFNRRYVLKMVEDEKNRADRQGHSFYICLLDIDHFKRINDTYGHAVGDTVLKIIAGAVQSQVRMTDCFGRYGGEEFLLLFNASSLAGALGFAERIRQCIEKIELPDFSQGLGITASFGIAEYQVQENISQTIARADAALYEAKSAGRNCVRFSAATTPPAGESNGNASLIKAVDVKG